MGCLIEFVKGWQSLIVGLAAVIVGWRALTLAIQTFETGALVIATKDEYPSKPDFKSNSHFVFFGRRLSHLPWRLAQKIVITTFFQVYGSFLFNHDLKGIKKEYEDARKNRKQLRGDGL